MAYLIRADFVKFIQNLNLSAVLGGNFSILDDFAMTAQEEAISYLIQKYDTSAEFTDTDVWDNSDSYNPGNRVYLDAPAYVAATSYIIGDTCTISQKYYTCTTNTTGAFDPTKWSDPLPQYQLYYVKPPFVEFDINHTYTKGDRVTYGNYVYECNQPSAIYDIIQYPNYQSIPPPNIFPGPSISSNSQWGVGVSYFVPVGTDITDNTLWTQGDNRGRKILQTVVNICLYYCHDRISPQNIPELRVKNYDEAIKWLKMAGRGEITPNLPRDQPNQGNRIRFGGTPKVSFNI